MKIFISAPRKKEVFRKTVEAIAQEKGHSTIYCPEQFRNLKNKQLSDKVIRELKTSHLVFMDVSMKKSGKEWFPNSGVLIEFGLAMNDPTKGLDFIYFFCDKDTDKNHLPPLIPRVEVTEYSEKDEDALKDDIREALRNYEKDLPERLRRAKLRAIGTEIAYETSKFTFDTTKYR